MQGKRVAPAAGVLLCENALLWLFALAEKKQGEERMESALSYTRVIENGIVLFFLFYIIIMLYLSSHTDRVSSLGVIFIYLFFFLKRMGLTDWRMVAIWRWVSSFFHSV